MNVTADRSRLDRETDVVTHVMDGVGVIHVSDGGFVGLSLLVWVTHAGGGGLGDEGQY